MALVESCISYCEIFREIYVIGTHSPVLSAALSNYGRKNEFYSVRFWTNEIYVMWNNAVDAEELYLKYFIKNVFDPFFTIRADWKDPNRQNVFPNYATLAHGGRHNLAVSGVHRMDVYRRHSIMELTTVDPFGQRRNKCPPLQR